MTPVILGVDFLHENALVLDFIQSPVVVRHTKPGPLPQSHVSLISDQVQVLPHYEAERRTQARACAIVAPEQPEADIIDECAVPNYHKTPNKELPECSESCLYSVVDKCPVVVRHTKPGPLPQSHVSLISDQVQVLPHYEAERRTQARACAIVAPEQPEADIIDECAVPNYHKTPNKELPECSESCLYSVVDKCRGPFCTTPGVTKIACHFISTTGNPVKVPPRCVPAHYREEVDHQIQTMLEQGIIEERSSPWMTPAEFVPKKSGDLRLCIDYRELNKKTTKDAYLLTLPDEVQDRLSGSTIFSTLDLHSGYWQLPVIPSDRQKTAFCLKARHGVI